MYYINFKGNCVMNTIIKQVHIPIIALGTVIIVLFLKSNGVIFIVICFDFF